MNEDWMIPELDFVILDLLPVEGTMAGPVPVGFSARAVQQRLKSDLLSVGNVSGRLRQLQAHGYARSIKTLVEGDGSGPGLRSQPKGKAYQITPAGVAALREWQTSQTPTIQTTEGDE